MCLRVLIAAKNRRDLYSLFEITVQKRVTLYKKRFIKPRLINIM